MLLLRKGCQPILNKYGLTSMHVSVSTSGTYGYLCIISKCGRTLVQLEDIPLRRADLDKDTREYAIELFKVYMEKASKDLIDYSKKHKYVAELKENWKPLPQSMEVSYTGSYKNKNYYLKVNIGSKGLRYNVYTNGNIKITGGLEGTLEEISKKVLRMKNKVGKDLVLLETSLELVRAKKEETDALYALNSQCSY